ncbi:MAG TPA: hypothetical protein VK615_06295 [Candidatus Binatia bacterium]|nr:hypothetical protein [Candidatus Binatia bacterium]
MNVSYFHTGIYTIPYASRLTKVSAGRMRRWLRGYRYHDRDKTTRSLPPLWEGQWQPIDHTLALGFLDLVEIRFVDAFLKAGVTWTTLHRARARAKELFKVSHPFSTNRFVTDGREILLETDGQSEQPSLLDIIPRQQVFAAIVKPLLRDLEYAGGTVVRWWALGTDRGVVLDPTRNFGRPIIARHGFPTEVLSHAAGASDSVNEVASWFELAERDVEDAVEFERQLAA